MSRLSEITGQCSHGPGRVRSLFQNERPRFAQVFYSRLVCAAIAMFLFRAKKGTVIMSHLLCL